jgi:xylulokinase
MDKMAEKIEKGSKGLIYLPYLMGYRSPHLDPNCSGVFFGLTPMHTKAHLIRSIMEGVVFSLKDSVEILKNDMGIALNEVRVSGGGAKSPLWKQMQGDIFGIDIAEVNNPEGGALGVAILAGVAGGIYKSVQSACDEMITLKKKKIHEGENTAEYNKFYNVYKGLYPVMKKSFSELRSIVR